MPRYSTDALQEQTTGFFVYAIVGYVGLDVHRPTTADPLPLGSYTDPLPTFPAEVAVALSAQASAGPQFGTDLVSGGETAPGGAFKEYAPYALPKGVPRSGARRGQGVGPGPGPGPIPPQPTPIGSSSGANAGTRGSFA